MSLLAMAALGAAYLLNRIRRPEPQPVPAKRGEEAEPELSLEKLRAAGF